MSQTQPREFDPAIPALIDKLHGDVDAADPYAEISRLLNWDYIERTRRQRWAYCLKGHRLSDKNRVGNRCRLCHYNDPRYAIGQSIGRLPTLGEIA